MVSPVLILVWFGLVVYQIYKWMFQKPPNFPPGPPRLPILGAYPYMLLINYKHLHRAIDWLCTYYKTDVLGFYAANFPTIVGNSTATVKELLNNPRLDGKPALKLAQLRDPEFKIRGIFFTEGQIWFEQRRFALRNLRDFGFGRRQDELETELQHEILNLIDLLKFGPKHEFEKKYHDGNSVVVPNIFIATFGNFFMKVVLNERLPREKLYILHEAGELTLYFARKSDAWGRMFSYNEWISKLFPNFSEFNLLRDASMKYYDCIKVIVDEQRKTYDPEHERHFLDICFKKIEDEKNNGGTSIHCYQQLVGVMADLFMPALIANALQLQFLLQRFHLQPEILKKCQQEIQTVVGHSRLPTLNDRQHLPYVESTIRESLRHDVLVPSGLPHTATADTNFQGYDIPKGAILFGSLHGSSLDEHAWDRPNQFEPERFLDETGKFSPKLDKSLPFGSGKRLCAGETFARNTLFVVVSALVQNFDITIPVNEKMPMPCDNCTGMLQFVPEYRLKFVTR